MKDHNKHREEATVTSSMAVPAQLQGLTRAQKEEKTDRWTHGPKTGIRCSQMEKP